MSQARSVKKNSEQLEQIKNVMTNYLLGHNIVAIKNTAHPWERPQYKFIKKKDENNNDRALVQLNYFSNKLLSDPVALSQEESNVMLSFIHFLCKDEKNRQHIPLLLKAPFYQSVDPYKLLLTLSYNQQVLVEHVNQKRFINKNLSKLDSFLELVRNQEDKTKILKTLLEGKTKTSERMAVGYKIYSDQIFNKNEFAATFQGFGTELKGVSFEDFKESNDEIAEKLFISFDLEKLIPDATLSPNQKSRLFLDYVLIELNPFLTGSHQNSFAQEITHVNVAGMSSEVANRIVCYGKNINSSMIKDLTLHYFFNLNKNKLEKIDSNNPQIELVYSAMKKHNLESLVTETKDKDSKPLISTSRIKKI